MPPILVSTDLYHCTFALLSSPTAIKNCSGAKQLHRQLVQHKGVLSGHTATILSLYASLKPRFNVSFFFFFFFFFNSPHRIRVRDSRPRFRGVRHAKSIPIHELKSNLFSLNFSNTILLPSAFLQHFDPIHLGEGMLLLLVGYTLQIGLIILLHEGSLMVVNATGATCSEDFESKSDEARVENKNVIFEEIDSGPAAAMDGYQYSGYSVNPPQKVKPRATITNVSPELLHLVDSVIMGKPESLDKLKNIVSGYENFESGDEMDSIANLVVDSLLATMGGVESFEEDEENNPPSVMLNSRAAIVAGDLIPWLPWVGDGANFMSHRTRMVTGLLAILRACTRNRAMCSMAGLLQVLLVSAQKIFLTEVASSYLMRWDETPLFYCIQYLAGHSLSVIDLHRWLQLIRRALTTVWASQLMFALEKAITGKESKGPACTFEFDGESPSLLGPRESNWPFTNGYAIATWIYIESFADTLNPATVEAAASALAGKDTAHKTF
ncbi:hypothetical protein SAY87_000853 [Trapa incisa]|uniref:Uncharacterized protein n=1 Tax=Trapa incisa TaxID=236973 RepID=A0AAN7JGY3_9MYRT|nr:hypothetical protein SAY87_000853 [Trapa incisa]